MRPLEDALLELAETVVRLREEVIDLHRRIANVHRPGKVSKLDPKKGLFKMKYAKDEDGQDIESPWIPWTQRAGGSKGQNSWDPPAIGEQMIMHSPSGDITEASWGSPGGWSNDNPQVHNKSGEEKYTVGAHTSRHMTGDAVGYKTKKFKIDAEIVDIEASQGARIKAPKVTVDGNNVFVNAKSVFVIDGDVLHIGKNDQTGIHTDRKGRHS